jgi:formiminoglutamase
MTEFAEFLISHNVSVPTTHSDDPRLGALITQNEVSQNSIFAIIGFPVDAGVAKNGGRVGAKAGPDAIRSWLYRLTPDAQRANEQIEFLRRGVDLGNVCEGENLAESQERLGKVVSALLTRGVVPIIIGGGHETSFGHFLGFVGAGIVAQALNIDAHPDVRELKDGQGHSGSPFRQALEHPQHALSRYTVFGLAAHGCAAAHITYLEERNCMYRWAHQMHEGEIERYFHHLESPGFVSFDLDALDQSIAPGVSRPNENGLDSGLWYEAAFLAGKCRYVRSLDIVEHNPLYDHDGATARVAAYTLWQFLRGLSQRF